MAIPLWVINSAEILKKPYQHIYILMYYTKLLYKITLHSIPTTKIIKQTEKFNNNM